MKLVIILACGRAGSDLLQSLFDWHPQILQFPGTFRFGKSFSDIFIEKNPEKISEMFCDMYPNFFDSRIEDITYGHLERWDKLGRKKKQLVKQKDFFCKRILYCF